MLPALVLLTAYVTETDPVAWLVNYGVAGIVIVLIVLGRLRTKAEVDGLVEALKEARASEKEKDVAVAALIAQLTGHTVPQIAQMAKVLEAQQAPVQNIDPSLLAALDRLTARLDEIERRA